MPSAFFFLNIPHTYNKSLFSFFYISGMKATGKLINLPISVYPIGKLHSLT
jgi:hypothetical protein